MVNRMVLVSETFPTQDDFSMCDINLQSIVMLNIIQVVSHNNYRLSLLLMLAVRLHKKCHNIKVDNGNQQLEVIRDVSR